MPEENKKNGVPEKLPIDLDQQMKMIENQIAELSGQHKLLQSMKEQGVEMLAPKSADTPVKTK
jgi:prefoldin subunit 5